MNLRDSINNLIRSDRPESPTDLIFIYGGLILVDLWIYATLKPATIPHLTEVIGFLVLCKTVKVGSDYQKRRKAASDVTTAENVDKPVL